MLNPNFVILGVIINILGGLSYLIATIKGRVKPNRVSWALWALIPLVAFSAEIKQGVGIQSLLTFIAGFNPLMVFVASFINKKSKWNITTLDIVCAILSLMGLFIWYITKVANIAIIFSILADALASIPTIVKSWYFPETEDYKVFLAAGISGIITLLTIKTWTLPYYGYPLYLFLVCLLLVVLIKFTLGKKFHKKH